MVGAQDIRSPPVGVNNGLCASACIAGLRKRPIGALSGGGTGQVQARGTRFIERDTKVLQEVFDEKSGCEVRF